MTQFGGMYLTEDRLGGQTFYNKDLPSNPSNGYGISIKTERAELFAKGGYFFPNNPEMSAAFITNAAYHSHQSYYGLTSYNAKEKSFYGNLIIEGIIGTTNHKYSTGLSYKYNALDEYLNDSTSLRLESVPGAYFEYTYQYASIFTFMAGIRGDYHNEFGFFATPRAHAKYNMNENNVFRISAGLGHRTANVLVENTYLLANGVPLIYKNKPEMESAGNYGISYIHYFKILNKKWTLMLDYYRTDFINQIIVDREDNNRIAIYNLDGKSFSNAAQVEIQAEPIKRLDVTLAFRYNDVRADFNNELLEVPMVNRYKGLVALSYATNLKKWQFDLNFQLNGDGRLPGSVQYGMRDYPSYWVVNAQVTKIFRKWSIYLGAENITDYVQDNPILNVDQPFSSSFDASQVWGPVHGRKIYLGLRYNIAKK
jgi:outer membrane cobalamin receptor